VADYAQLSWTENLFIALCVQELTLYFVFVRKHPPPNVHLAFPPLNKDTKNYIFSESLINEDYFTTFIARKKNRCLEI